MLTEENVKLAASIKAETLSEGKEIPDIDILIACSGGEKCKLLTCDKHQLELSNYLKKHNIEVEPTF